MRQPQIGLSDKQREGSIAALNTVLCDENLLLIKTKKSHWDVVGPQFLTIHKLLDDHYETIADFVDKVAERIRALGGYPIGTAAGFIEHATLREQPGELGGVTQILGALLDDHEAVIRTLRASAERAEQANKDRGTSDFLVQILQQHEEMAWMLRSFLEGEAVMSDGRVNLPPRATPSLA